MRLTIEEVIRVYKDRLFTAALHVCRHPADAEDAVQDTFIKYFTCRKDFADEEHIKAWLIRVAINRAKDISASFWRKNKISLDDYMETIPFEAPEDSELFEAVMKLPRKYRIAIHLFYFEDYPIKEIAEILRCREGTVKSQLSRARVLLKTMLKEKWNDE